MSPDEAFDPEAYTARLREAWSEAAPRYDAFSARHFARLTAGFMTFAGLRSGERVLDVACGAGLASMAAAQKVLPDGTVAGVDLAPGMLRAARERAQALGLPIRFSEMNAEALDFREGSFDAVVCQLGLMLFSKPASALSEMARVVRKGGRVACLVQGSPEKMVLTSLVMRHAVKHAPELKIPGAPTLYAFAPPGVLKRAFSAAGLTEVVEARESGTCDFESPRDFWDTVTEAGGRMRAMLDGLEPGVRAAVERDSLEEAATYAQGGRLAIPYEVVMARGLKR